MRYENDEEKEIMSCKFRRFVRNGNTLVVEDYTCDEIKQLFPKWDENFIKENLVDIHRPDRYYLGWKKQIEDFLMNCDCESKDDFDWEDKSDPYWLQKRIDHAKKLRSGGKGWGADILKNNLEKNDCHLN